MSEQTEKHDRADLTASKPDDFLARLRRGFALRLANPRPRNAARVWHSCAFLGSLLATLFFAGCADHNKAVNFSPTLSLSVSPSQVTGGASATGQVRLDSPTATATIQLTSSNPSVAMVPDHVMVTGSGTFQVTTSTVTQPTQVTITAVAPNGATQMAVLTVNPLTVASVTLNPTAVMGGTPSTGTVTLTGPAPPGGAVVTLSSSNMSAATVPANAVVPAGMTTANFSVTTIPGTTQAHSTITAAYNGSANAVLEVDPPPPTLTAVSPTRVYQGQSYTFTLTGTNFTPGATVNAGTGVTVSNVNATPDGTMITADFNIGGPGVAPTGNHLVSVTTPSGTTHNVVGFVVDAPPTLTGISPASGVQGATALALTITGTNFAPGATVTFAGTGITVTSSGISADQKTITLTVDIAAGATLGSHGVTVNTNGLQLSNPNVTFTVNAPPSAPTLTSITPPSGTVGSTFAVTLTGTGFASPMSVNTGVGVTATNTTVMNSTTATATFTIDPTAPTGAQNVTVTTVAGTSGNVTFTVNPASSSGPCNGNFALLGHGFDSTATPLDMLAVFPVSNGSLGGEYVTNYHSGISTGSLRGSCTVDTLLPNANRGKFTLTSPTTGPFANASFLLNLSADGNDGTFIEVDNNGNVISGSVFRQDTSAFSLSALGGPAYGITSRTGIYTSQVGQLVVNGATGSATGFMDEAKAGTGPTATKAAISGTMTAPDLNGLGRLSLTTPSNTMAFAYLAVGKNAFLKLQIDPISSTNSTTFSGRAERQQGPFSNPITDPLYAGYNGVFELQGRNPVSGGASFAAGQLRLVANGGGGVTFDGNDDGTVASNASTPLTGISFDPILGRYDVVFNRVSGWADSLALYNVTNGSGFILETTSGTSAEAREGRFVAQLQAIVAFKYMNFLTSFKPGGSITNHATGSVNEPQGNFQAESITLGSPPATGLTGTIQFGTPDATGRASVVLPGNLFNVQTPTVNGTVYFIDSNRAALVSSNPFASGGVNFLGLLGLAFD